MTEKREWWSDDLIDAVFRALSHTYRAQGWTGGIAIDLDESVYPLIAAVEDWHEKFVMHGAFRVLAERAASAEIEALRARNETLIATIQRQDSTFERQMEEHEELEALRAQVQRVRAAVGDEHDNPTGAFADLRDWDDGWNKCRESVIDALDGGDA